MRKQLILFRVSLNSSANYTMSQNYERISNKKFLIFLSKLSTVIIFTKSASSSFTPPVLSAWNKIWRIIHEITSYSNRLMHQLCSTVFYFRFSCYVLFRNIKQFILLIQIKDVAYIETFPFYVSLPSERCTCPEVTARWIKNDGEKRNKQSAVQIFLQNGLISSGSKLPLGIF